MGPLWETWGGGGRTDGEQKEIEIGRGGRGEGRGVKGRGAKGSRVRD